MPEFMVQLRAIDAIGARALEFTILTAARTIETLGAQWSEIDFAASVWQVPGERMKAGKEHRVPLTAEALAILGDVPRLQGNPFIFPGAKKGRGLSNLAMLMTLRRIRPGLTVHGFRSSFRDWAAESTGFAREIAEASLAHTIGNAVERSYRRGDFFAKRAKLMEAWSSYCGRGQSAAEVIPMRKGA
jgi:integrase